MNIHDDFEEFLRLLNSESVDYVIVGGYAVAYHGYIRTTQDLDILFANNKDNIEKICRAMIHFGFTEQAFDATDFSEPGSIIRMGVPPVRIELINEISGVTFDEVWITKVTGKYGTVSVFYIGKQELLKNKKAAGRPKDVADIDELT